MPPRSPWPSKWCGKIGRIEGFPIIPTTSRALAFRDRLNQRILVADGAMGTMLYGRGIFINQCFDNLNLTSPNLVADVHKEYVQAGAEILETNTFGANRLRL